jgi:predicted dehydrogenase
VIGCGRVGSQADEPAPAGDDRWTHAGAYRRVPGIDLAALCDRDAGRVAAAARAWGVPRTYTDHHALLAGERLDVLSVCTPADTRLDVIRCALEHGVRVVFCEKPLAATVDEARRIRALAAEAGAVVAVNYLRRWDPSVRAVKNLVAGGSLGALQAATGHYGKGVRNNGTHLLDLLTHLVGRPTSLRAGRRVAGGWSPDDPTLDAHLAFATAAGPAAAALLATDDRPYTVFDLDLVFTGGRVRFADSGRVVELYTPGPDPQFSGYRTLGLERTWTGGLGQALVQAAQEMVALHRGECPRPSCGPDEAVEALAQAEALVRSHAAGGATLTSW